MDSFSNFDKKHFYRIDEVIDDIKLGKTLIIIDDISTENEGVLFQAAEKVKNESMSFFMTHGKGFIYLPCEQKRLD